MTKQIQTVELPEELNSLINAVVSRIEQQKNKREPGATKAIKILKQEIATALAQDQQEAVEKAKKDFEDRDIEVELDTKQCLEVAQVVYEKYQEAMKPPVFAVYQFPDWLNRQLEALQTKEKGQ